MSGQATLVQNDLFGSHLPNGMLYWWGFDFNRVDMPDEPALTGEEPPRWVGCLPGFFAEMHVLDAKVMIEADEFELGDEEEGTDDEASPTSFRITVDAPGAEERETFTCRSWPEVQQTMRRTERTLDESFVDRHHRCADENGGPTEDACDLCAR